MPIECQNAGGVCRGNKGLLLSNTCSRCLKLMCTFAKFKVPLCMGWFSLRKTNFWDSARFGALIVQYDETDDEWSSLYGRSVPCVDCTVWRDWLRVIFTVRQKCTVRWLYFMTRLTTTDLQYTAEVYRAFIVRITRFTTSDLQCTAEACRAFMVQYD